MKIYQLIQALEEIPQNTDVVLLDSENQEIEMKEIKKVQMFIGINEESTLSVATIKF